MLFRSRWESASACGLCAVSPGFLYFGAQTLSELPFAVVWFLALHLTERQAHRPSLPVAGGLALGMAWGLPALFRSIGVAILLPAAAAMRRFGWRSVAPLVGSAVVLGPWVLWSRTAKLAWSSDSLAAYYTDYFGWWNAGLGSLIGVMRQNLVLILVGTCDLLLDRVFAPFAPTSGPAWILFCLLLGGAALEIGRAHV